MAPHSTRVSLVYVWRIHILMLLGESIDLQSAIFFPVGAGYQ